MQETNDFISYLANLERVANGEDPTTQSSHDQSSARAALAKLRRGLGQPPGTTQEMFPYVVPFLPNDTFRGDTYFLIAALFAYHPDPGGTGNMGSHFANAREPESDSTAIERRFTALLAAHGEELHYHLRHAVGFLRSRQTPVPVNWHKLFGDILNWSHPSSYVQKEWARAFWGRPQTPPSPSLPAG